jgi:hypothetical protein
MTVMELGALGEFVGSILTILTLIYLATQVRQNTAQQKREELVSVQHGQNSVMGQMQDPRIVRAFAQAADNGFAASIEDRAIAIIWVIQYLNHFQIVYDLHQSGSMDDDRYALWEGFAVGVVASGSVRDWWDNEAGRLGFMPEVRDLIDRRLTDEVNPPTPVAQMWSIFMRQAWASDSTHAES